MKMEGQSNSLVINIRHNDAVLNEVKSSNQIKTTKYTILTWLPKSLWEQFRRIANMYFLVMTILMLIGYYDQSAFPSPLNPYSTLITLIVVLLVTSIKEGVEDLQRARSDRYENLREVTVVRFDMQGNASETTVESQTLVSGDVIKLTGQTAVPVDLVLLHTSLYNDGNQCYVETSNIDGETNLKLRMAPSACKGLITSDIPNMALFKGSAEYEKPNKNIHDFIGTLKLEAYAEPIALSADNMCLRGSIFSNTEWAYGIAIYTGQESKIQMNNMLARYKLSMIEKYVNTAIIMIGTAQLITVSVTVICLYALGYNNFSKFPYVYTNGKGDSVLPMWLEYWIVYLLLYNNFIPISLYVTMEMVNIGQAFFVSSDVNIYDETLDSPCIVRSSNHVQELGVVSNVFSDKTGTLTRNEMKFVKFIVQGRTYDVETTTITNRGSVFESPVFESIRENGTESNPLFKFIHCLTICHTVVREKNGTFRSESPDELALVEGVSKFNCGLLERGTTTMTVQIFGNKLVLEVLAVNAFNSDRKRMSVLVLEPITGKYYVMLKGADSTVLGLCRLSNEVKEVIDNNLLSLACLGLRTLCVARKEIDASAASTWLKRFKEAGSAIHNRSAQLDEVAAVLETDMELLGITAIEDRLQDEVPEVIADLTRAGIIVWMLTGDKEETAINIGHSCNLLQQETATFTLTRVHSPEEYKAKLKSIHDAVVNRRFSKADITASVQRDDGIRECSFVMDGPSFHFFNEEDLDQRKWLLAIGKHSRSVIGCRLTPGQKQQLVKIVKTDTVPKAITLSIGDGANDVSMIREADVGVGIIGKEGRQAANNADFAIGQFKFLRRLLLVHGRWNYIRQSNTFLYSMHKNLVLTYTIFWFSYLSGISGTTPYDSWIYSAFNIALGLPIVFFGILDKDLSAEFVLAHPEVYSTGIKNAYLNRRTIVLWILNALAYTCMICLIAYVAMIPTFSHWTLDAMGTMVYLATVMSLHLKVIFLHCYWTHVNTFMMALSVGGIFLFIYVLTSLSDPNYIEYDCYGMASWLYNEGFYWFIGFFSIPLFSLLIDLVGQSIRLAVFPTREMLYREQEYLLNRRFLQENHVIIPEPK